jgi:hypothetical protein
MTIYLSIFRRGRSLQVREQDHMNEVFVFLRWTKLRGGIVQRQLSLESSAYDGGIQFRRLKDGRNQGWRLRGPVEHFEY